MAAAMDDCVLYGRRHFTWARGAAAVAQADLPRCNLLGQYTRSRKTTDAVARVLEDGDRKRKRDPRWPRPRPQESCQKS